MKDSTFNRLYHIASIFKPSIDRWIVKSLIGGGLAIIASGITGVSWYFAIALNIIKSDLKVQLGTDYFFNVIEWKSVTIGIIIFCIGLIIYFFNKWLYSRVKRPNKILIAILHKSIDDFLKPDFKKLRNGFYKGYDIHEIDINQTIIYEDGSLNYQEVALMIQRDINTKIRTLAYNNPEYEIAYFGLAHIPLLFLLGTQLADKYNIDFFEYNRNKYSWDYMKDEPPTIFVTQNFEVRQLTENSEGIIVIEVSYKVDDSFINDIVPENNILCRISLDKISLDAISNRNDISLISKTFRDCVDYIIENNPEIKTLHLFYAGPVCLAVNIARKISKRTDPNFIVYNFQRNASPKYKWGVSLNSTNEKLIVN
jgi:hypothetical protein